MHDAAAPGRVELPLQPWANDLHSTWTLGPTLCVCLAKVKHSVGVLIVRVLHFRLCTVNTIKDQVKVSGPNDCYDRFCQF